MRKFFTYTLVVLIVLVLAIELTGNHHLYFAMQHTVLQGRWGPSIDEYAIYPNRTVSTARHQEWPVIDLDEELTEKELAYHQDLGTAAFLVFRRDSILFEYYDEQHSDTSHMNPWSMSKSVMALLIGVALDEGLINGLQDPISDYLEGYEGSGITIEHLLGMSSGINFTESYINPFAHSAKSLYGTDLKALNKDYHPVTDPGKVFNYQGGNTILLSMILESLIDVSVSEYASEKLWRPMGAEHPAFWSLDRKDGHERSFCCFNSTAKDFARFGKLVKHRGVWEGDTLISSQFLDLMTSPVDLKLENGSQNQKYGLHWWVLLMDDYQGFYARGIQGQYLAVLPAEDLMIIRLGDKRVSERVEGHVIDMLSYIDMARRLASY